MKKFIALLFCCVLLWGCNAAAAVNESEEFDRNMAFEVSKIPYIAQNSAENPTEKEMRGIWVSQFDMHPIFRNGSSQRDKNEYIAIIEKMMSNLSRDGFNTIFLQLRPNGDSMYESDIYPASKYIAGEYGGEIEYDAIEIFLSIAKKRDISVHGWINPFRLCGMDELEKYGKGLIFNWYKEGLGKRIEIGDKGILYLDPAYEEATDLIVSGVEEILTKYDFDGIHLDDYFYPTEFEFIDEAEFLKSGFDSKGDFRRENINRTVKAIYDTCHAKGKIFGVSPAGNIYSLSDGWYVDIYKWCSTEGYVDYILPQLYYGFENKYCPFDKVLNDWSEAVTSDSISLYIGLSAAKCELGSKGLEDKHAGEGKFEWRDNKDILKRSLLKIRDCNNSSGFCVFTYSSFYDPITGNDNTYTLEEKTAFCEFLH